MDDSSRKPLHSSVFALHRYANKMQTFYSKCINVIEFAKDFCLNPRKRTDVQDQGEMKSWGGGGGRVVVEGTEKLVHPGLVQLFSPCIYAFRINTLQCGFSGTVAHTESCSLVSVLREAANSVAQMRDCGKGEGVAQAGVWFLSSF